MSPQHKNNTMFIWFNYNYGASVLVLWGCSGQAARTHSQHQTSSLGIGQTMCTNEPTYWLWKSTQDHSQEPCYSWWVQPILKIWVSSSIHSPKFGSKKMSERSLCHSQSHDHWTQVQCRNRQTNYDYYIQYIILISGTVAYIFCAFLPWSILDALQQHTQSDIYIYISPQSNPKKIDHIFKNATIANKTDQNHASHLYPQVNSHSYGKWLLDIISSLIYLPVVPHKAVAEVSNIGNL